MAEMFSSQEEFDVSDAGVPTLENVPALISEFEVVEKDKGVSHEVTFEIEGLGFPVTKGYWFEHDNPKAQQAGRGQLKRIAKAATGRTTYTASSLKGQRVLISVREDDSGFAQITRISPVEN